MFRHSLAFKGDFLFHSKTWNFLCAQQVRIDSHYSQKRVVQGGSLARFTDEKTNESRITDIEISFSRITKISTLLSCYYATNSI